VLTQIGLGYWALHLFRTRPEWNWSPRSWLLLQGIAAAVVLIGYGAWFQSYTIPEEERATVERFVTQQMQSRGKTDAELERELGLTRDFTGVAVHWNKHTNAAAAVDRWFLNRFPRQEPEWEGARFWINDGGYQTLNFIPSLATMMFGLMAGTVLRAGWTMRDVLRWMILAGAACFLVAMALDTSTWPIQFASWSICPAVKRIWSPTWAVFSSGWTFWMLAAFYWVVDIWGCRRLAWPFAVVGMNSIAMYCMSQLMGGWTRETLKTHSATLDFWLGLDQGLGYLLTQSAYAPLNSRLAVLCVFWLICLWMYRRSIFIRI
jgi:predicted acyltransferase